MLLAGGLWTFGDGSTTYTDPPDNGLYIDIANDGRSSCQIIGHILVPAGQTGTFMIQVACSDNATPDQFIALKAGSYIEARRGGDAP